jgi:deoxyribose-phosphate aldolase
VAEARPVPAWRESALLADIERQLEHYLTGRYSSNDRHGMA